jgi:hypothetical protein
MNDFKKLQDLRVTLLQKIKPAAIDRDFCNLLSITIFTTQNDYLSTNTLMQVFGLLPLNQRNLNHKVIDMLDRYTSCAEVRL